MPTEKKTGAPQRDEQRQGGRIAPGTREQPDPTRTSVTGEGGEGEEGEREASPGWSPNRA